MAIASINTDQAQSVVALGDTLAAFLELAKDAKKWKAASDEVSKASELVTQAKEVDDKLRQIQAGVATLAEGGKEQEALKAANLARQNDLDKREMAIQPREQAAEKREAELVKSEEALAKKGAALDKAIAKAEAAEGKAEKARLEAEAAKESYAKLSADSLAIVEKYNQAIANLQAAQV